MAIPSMAGIISSCKSTPSFEVSTGILNLDSMPLNIFTEAFGLQPPWPLWHGRRDEGAGLAGFGALHACEDHLPIRLACSIEALYAAVLLVKLAVEHFQELVHTLERWMCHSFRPASGKAQRCNCTPGISSAATCMTAATAAVSGALSRRQLACCSSEPVKGHHACMVTRHRSLNPGNDEAQPVLYKIYTVRPVLCVIR